MPVFSTHRESRKGKRYDTIANTSETETTCSENNNLLSAHGSNTDSESGALILTQGEVDEQIRTYIALLTKQQEDLTWLIQGMPSAHWQNLSPKSQYQC